MHRSRQSRHHGKAHRAHNGDKKTSKSGETIVRRLRRLDGAEPPAVAITDWQPCGVIETAPNPQLDGNTFDVEIFESGMQNGLGFVVHNPEDLHGRGFVLTDDGPLGPAIAVPKTGLYQVNALMRFLPTIDDGNAQFQDMWEPQPLAPTDATGFDVTPAGRAHLVGSRIVALRVLRNNMIVDTIEGKNEAYELCSDDAMWVGHRVANVSGTVALERHDRLVLQAWQNSGEDQACFVRFSALCVS